MNVVSSYCRYAARLALILSGAWAAGCGDSHAPSQGMGGNAGPTVMAVTPVDQASGVLVGAPGITATFSEAVAPISGAASFTLTCAAPCTSPTGTVALNANAATASYTLTTATVLAPATLYTVTISAARSVATGIALQAPFVWTFTTQAGPTVTAVSPVNLASAVAINDRVISAAFSEPVTPFVGAATITLSCAAPCLDATGSVALSADNAIASFALTPATTLAPLTLYTATVSGATSLATGIGMASPYAWQFTTGSSADLTRPSVALTNPATTTPGPTMAVPANTAVSAVL